MNYTKLSQRIHAANVAKGFWPEDGRDMGEVFALIHAEASEALEAHRKGLPMDVSEEAWMAWGIVEDARTNPKLTFALHAHQTYKDWFKDKCVAEELADVVIRILDLMGYFECDFTRTGPTKEVPAALTFGAAISVVHIFVAEANSALIADDLETCIRRLIGVVAFVELVCELHNINLSAHIEAKLAYNSTRPAKHGKLY
jgi:hypothetical protein